MSAVEKLPSMYELSQEWREVLDALEASQGEVTDELQQRLQELEARTIQKIDGCGWVLTRLAGEAAMFTERATVLRQKATARVQAADRLKQRLADFLQSRDLTSIKGEEFQVSLRHSEAVVVECPTGALPVDYLTIPEPVPNKPELKRALKAGETIPGVRLESRPYVVLR